MRFRILTIHNYGSIEDMGTVSLGTNTRIQYMDEDGEWKDFERWEVDVDTDKGTIGEEKRLDNS